MSAIFVRILHLSVDINDKRNPFGLLPSSSQSLKNFVANRSSYDDLLVHKCRNTSIFQILFLLITRLAVLHQDIITSHKFTLIKKKKKKKTKKIQQRILFFWAFFLFFDFIYLFLHLFLICCTLEAVLVIIRSITDGFKYYSWLFFVFS